MSDDTFMLPTPPLMTPEKAMETARGYKALADHMSNIGSLGEAGRLERSSQWWMTCSIALAQMPTKT